MPQDPQDDCWYDQSGQLHCPGEHIDVTPGPDDDPQPYTPSPQFQGPSSDTVPLRQGPGEGSGKKGAPQKGGSGDIFGWLKKIAGKLFGGGGGQQNPGTQLFSLNDFQTMLRPKQQLDSGDDYFSRLFNQNKMKSQQPFQWGGFNG